MQGTENLLELADGTISLGVSGIGALATAAQAGAAGAHAIADVVDTIGDMLPGLPRRPRRRQRAIGEDAIQRIVIPRIVRPLAQAIASR